MGWVQVISFSSGQRFGAKLSEPPRTSSFGSDSPSLSKTRSGRG